MRTDLIAFVTVAVGAVGLHNRALEVLGRNLRDPEQGSLRQAEALAEQALAAGGEAMAPYAQSLLAHVAYHRAALAEQQASGPEAEPFAYDAAIAYARGARDRWVQAVVGHHALTGDDWPAMRRNVERAMHRIRELEAAKAAAERDSQKADDTPEVNPMLTPDDDATAPPDQPPPDREGDPAAQEAPPQLEPAQVQALLQLLEQKETDKRTLRATRRQSRSSQVEKDW